MHEYKLIKSPRSKRRTSIRLNTKGEVEVRAPRWVPKFMIDQFVRSQSDWIKKVLAEFQNRPKRKLDHGSRLPLFGHELILEITFSDSRKKVALKFLDDSLWASVPRTISAQHKQKQLERLLFTWYKEQALKTLTQLTRKYSEKLKVRFNQIRIKNHQSRWGSCSSKGNINYNWRLSLAPLEVSEYVVIHEVCHLVHHNHSRAFWQLVGQLEPNYKRHIKWLQTNRYQLELI